MEQKMPMTQIRWRPSTS